MTAFIRTVLASVIALAIVLPAHADNNQATQQQPAINSETQAANNQEATTLTTTVTTEQQTTTKEATDNKATTEAATTPININTADAKTISATLKDTNNRRANAIIAYRTKNGPFKSVDDLAKVKGLNKNWLEKNRDMVTVG